MGPTLMRSQEQPRKIERSTRQVHILACNPSNAARRELPDDMRLSNRDAIVDECGSGGHPHDLPSANVPNTWASKRHAAAETTGILNAAALVYWLDPWRARPPYKWEEKD